ISGALKLDADTMAELRGAILAVSPKRFAGALAKKLSTAIKFKNRSGPVSIAFEVGAEFSTTPVVGKGSVAYQETLSLGGVKVPIKGTLSVQVSAGLSVASWRQIVSTVESQV